MNVSAKTEYACIAVLELARHFPRDGPVRVASIAEAHGIPARFLVQILLQLKAAGLVESTRGAAGGYQLSRDPRQITLGEVMSVIEGPLAKVSTSAADETATSRVLTAAWQEVAAAEQEMLDAVTFADLARKVQGDDQMYYI
jgi:Rrf2 family cysteine metabolism transcriptional repressor